MKGFVVGGVDEGFDLLWRYTFRLWVKDLFGVDRMLSGVGYSKFCVGHAQYGVGCG